MNLCECSGVTLVGKFTNRMVEIEKNYAENKKSCEVIKMIGDYNYEKNRLIENEATVSMLTPLIRFEKEDLTNLIKNHALVGHIKID